MNTKQMKPFKLGNKYKVVKDPSSYSGSKVLGLEVGDEIDTGDGRFMIDREGGLCLIKELREHYTFGTIAPREYLQKSGKHQLQVGDTVTVKTDIRIGRHTINCSEGWLNFNASMAANKGKELVITQITSSGTFKLVGNTWNWANEWLTFKAPKPYVAPVDTLVETCQSAAKPTSAVVNVPQPINPFDRKDLGAPEWAKYAAHDDDDAGVWHFYNMKPEQFEGSSYFKRGFDERAGFKSERFSHNHTHSNFLDSVIERYIPFKAGEVVRVKDIKVGEHHSKLVPNQQNYFVRNMLPSVGKFYTVEGRSVGGNVSLCGETYIYLPDWLERVEQPTPTPIPAVESSKLLTPKQLLKQRQQTFKVGDRVVLVGGKPNEETLDGSARYDERKQKHQGKVATIKNMWSCNCDITIVGVDGESIGWVSPDWIVKESEYLVEPEQDRQYSHYFKDVSKIDTIDVYQVLDLFNVTNPCLQHIVKKALVTGGRTAGKDFSQDLREIRDTAIRAVEMYEQSKAD